MHPGRIGTGATIRTRSSPSDCLLARAKGQAGRLNHPNKTKGDKMREPQTPERFFYEHAGWSYDPKTETSEQGRRRCAKRLAQAEAFAKRHRMRFEWSKDDITNRSFTDEGPEYRLYQVLAYLDGRVCGSLGGVDFGQHGKPASEPYARVVEAELALDPLHEWELKQDAECRDIVTV